MCAIKAIKNGGIQRTHASLDRTMASNFERIMGIYQGHLKGTSQKTATPLAQLDYIDMSRVKENGNYSDNADCSIRPIPETFVHRMVAGQAITDLTSAVKELVDNALDAGARSVTIRLVSYGGENAPGLDEIEVSDDGTGVPMSDRPLLATKHATSKLNSIDQLYCCAGGSNSNNNTDDKMATNPCITLGFRGEALFSLASVCQTFYVTTKCENEIVGQKIHYDHSGNIYQTQSVPRKIGTSVTAIKLFDTLPVRRVDLIKRAKTHRLKLFKILQSYAILCKGIQFRVVDVTMSDPTFIDDSSARKKRKHANKTDIKLVTSVNNTDFESTVSSVLGCKMLEGMCRIPVIKGDVPNHGHRQQHRKKGDPQQQHQHCQENWSMEGLVSYAPGAAPGGATSREMQFLSINNRPVELLPSFTRVINDTWRSLFSSSTSGGKRPACVLALHVPPHVVDVNVSPDKREVILVNEDDVCSALQSTLVDLWSKQVGGIFIPHAAESNSNINNILGEMERVHQLQVQQRAADTVKATISLPMAINQLSPKAAQSMIRGNNSDNNDVASTQMTDYSHTSPTAPIRHFHNTAESMLDSQNTTIGSLPAAGLESSPLVCEVQNVTIVSSSYSGTSPISSSRRKMPRRNAFLHDFGNMSTAQPDITMAASQAAAGFESGVVRNGGDYGTEQSFQTGPLVSPVMRFDKTSSPLASDDSTRTSKISLSLVVLSDHSIVDSTMSKDSDASKSKNKSLNTEEIESSFAVGGYSLKQEITLPDTTTMENVVDSHVVQHEKIVWNSFSGNDAIVRQFKAARGRMKYTSNELRRCCSTANSLSSVRSSTGSVNEDLLIASKVGESVGIADGDFSSSKKRDQRTITLTKEEFSHLNIVGQFNLGFMLAICRNFHLWILDQHACDEKYNFEHLVNTTVLKEQKLLKPLPLELSPQEEHCIIENMSEFEKNGFRFIYDSEKPPRQRLSLTALPHSGSGGDGKKAVQFGKEDVGALCSILGANDDSSDYNSEWRGGENGKYGNNAVRRYGTGQSLTSQSSDGALESNVTKRSAAGGIDGLNLARLPKAIAMFASRACRSSVMIGDPLSMNQMESLVRKMRDVDNPWDCAHGRPTVRHVTDLQNLLYEEETTAAQFIASSCIGVLSQIENEI